MLVAGLIMLGAFILCAVFAPLIAPYGFAQRADASGSFGTQQPPSPEHLFGTTVGGYDVLSRSIRCPDRDPRGHRGRHLSLFIGVALGLYGGYFGGWLDKVMVVVFDAIYAFPSLCSRSSSRSSSCASSLWGASSPRRLDHRGVHPAVLPR